MLTSSLAPYLLWAKSRQPAPIDLAGSNLLPCTIDDLPGARDALDITAPNDDGFAPLLEAIAAHYGVTSDRVATAGGCSGANFLVVAALVGAGDEVVLERPSYDPLEGACRLMGARLVRVDRRFEDGFRLDPDRVRDAITPRTRLVILTSPHNPSGVTIDAATLTTVGAAADRVGAHVLVDEVYLDAANAAGAGAARPAAATLDGPFITTSSLTKSYGLAGLRAGWAVAPAGVVARLRRTRDVVDNAGNAPGDRLAAFAWRHQPALLARARTLLARNLGVIRAFLDAQPRLEVAEPPAASVTFPRLAGTPDAAAFIDRLLGEHGVAVAPGRFFDAPAHFRIALAGDTRRLEAGLARLDEALRA
ncbi:MAG: pyridoxal phosphate-dependent aminotransferase [Vicinamibacterales bacterium]